MADEPQFHMTVVTQKRRRVERLQSSHGEGSRRSASSEKAHSGDRGAHSVPAGETSTASAAGVSDLSRKEAQAALAGADAERALDNGRGAASGEAAASAQGTGSTAQAGSNRADGAGSRHGGGSSGGSGSRSRSSRRRYKDYGTVDLGKLRDTIEEEKDFTDDPDGPTPTQGEMQQQFYRKYDAILNRRYLTRNRTKVTRVVVIALLVALVFVISLFAISSFTGDDAETLAPPEVSTIPMETLDLG